jgi:hypothetical protein
LQLFDRFQIRGASEDDLKYRSLCRERDDKDACNSPNLLVPLRLAKVHGTVTFPVCGVVICKSTCIKSESVICKSLGVDWRLPGFNFASSVSGSPQTHFFHLQPGPACCPLHRWTIQPASGNDRRRLLASSQWIAAACMCEACSAKPFGSSRLQALGHRSQASILNTPISQTKVSFFRAQLGPVRYPKSTTELNLPNV